MIWSPARSTVIQNVRIAAMPELVATPSSPPFKLCKELLEYGYHGIIAVMLPRKSRLGLLN